MADNQRKNDLEKVAAIAVTMTGRAPSLVSWQLTEADICGDVLKLLSALITDIKEVTIEPSSDKDRIDAFAWISSDSDHVVDRSNGNKLIISKPINRYSKPLKELMDKYCPKDCRRLVSDQSSGGRLLGIPIDLVKVYQVLMDTSGEYAKNEYGSFVKSRISLTANYRENNSGDRPKILYLEVTKSTAIKTSRRPRPVKNFNY